jgi:hypothetical protein
MLTSFWSESFFLVMETSFLERRRDCAYFITDAAKA